MVEVTIRDTETGIVTEKVLRHAIIVGSDTNDRRMFWFSKKHLSYAVLCGLTWTAVDGISCWLRKNGYSGVSYRLAMQTIADYAKLAKKHPKSVVKGPLPKTEELDT